MTDREPGVASLNLPDKDWDIAHGVYNDQITGKSQLLEHDGALLNFHRLGDGSDAIYEIMREQIERDSLTATRPQDLFGLIPETRELYVVRGYELMSKDQKRELGMRISTGEIAATNPPVDIDDILDLHNILAVFNQARAAKAEVEFIKDLYAQPAYGQDTRVFAANEVLKSFNNLTRVLLGLPKLP